MPAGLHPAAAAAAAVLPLPPQTLQYTPPPHRFAKLPDVAVTTPSVPSNVTLNAD